jgi:hypothetical protein
MADGQASQTRSLTRLGSVTTFSFPPQSRTFAQKFALVRALKLPAAHGAHCLSLEFVGVTLTKKPGSH